MAEPTFRCRHYLSLVLIITLAIAITILAWTVLTDTAVAWDDCGCDGKYMGHGTVSRQRQRMGGDRSSQSVGERFHRFLLC